MKGHDNFGYGRGRGGRGRGSNHFQPYGNYMHDTSCIYTVEHLNKGHVRIMHVPE